MSRKKEKHKLTKHHKKPSSIGGDSSSRNISLIPRHQHEAWHCIVSNMTAQTICAVINEKFLDPDYRFICVPVEREIKILKTLQQLT